MANEKRLIDANELMKQVKAIHKAVDTSTINLDYDTGFHSATSQVQGLIAYMPTVDAVEVMRCKDCKHYKPQNQGAHRNCTTPYCVRVVAVKVSPDDFCSYGERKDNDD